MLHTQQFMHYTFYVMKKDSITKKDKQKIDYSRIPLFSGISDENLKILMMCLHSFEKSFHKGEIIIMDREQVHYVGVVLKGRVNMFKDDIWGNRTLLSYTEEGDMFGESFAVQKETMSYVTFAAASDTDVLFIAAWNVVHNCPKGCSFHTQLTQNMFDLVGQKTVRLMEKIEISSKASLREKILAYLSMQAQKQHSRYIELPIGRTELAAYLGANRSALTRELNAMRSDGLIDFDRNTFVIKDNHKITA